MEKEELFEELFKKRPFIYKIDGDYFAMGFGVCTKIPYLVGSKSKNPVTLSLRYDRYIEALKNAELSDDEARKVFNKLSSCAEMIGSDIGKSKIKKEDFDQLGFGKKQLEELSRQLNTMVGFFKKYRLQDH